MSNNTTNVFMLIVSLIAACAAFFMLTQCVATENENGKEIRMACIQKGGNWSLVNGSNGDYGCQFK